MSNEPVIDSGMSPFQPQPRPYQYAWAKVLILLAYLAVIVLLSVSGSGDTSGLVDMTNPAMIVAMKLGQVISFIILFIGPALLFAGLAFPERLKGLRLHIGPKGLTFLLVILLMVAALPIINWMAEWNNKMTLPESMSGIEEWMRASEDYLAELTKAFLADSSVGGLILNLFVIAFMAAVSEELLFRGVIQEAFARATKNVHVAVWVTAILFSVIHLQFFGFFPRMMLGALLGYLFVWTRSLWIPILAHFVNNGMAVLLAWLVARKEIDAEAETMGSEQGDMMLAFASIVIVAGLLYAIYRYEKGRRAKLSS